MTANEIREVQTVNLHEMNDGPNSTTSRFRARVQGTSKAKTLVIKSRLFTKLERRKSSGLLLYFGSRGLLFVKSLGRHHLR